MSQLAFQPAYDAEKALQPAKVCVTGVTGFVAGKIMFEAKERKGFYSTLAQCNASLDAI